MRSKFQIKYSEIQKWNGEIQIWGGKIQKNTMDIWVNYPNILVFFIEYI